MVILPPQERRRPGPDFCRPVCHQRLDDLTMFMTNLLSQREAPHDRPRSCDAVGLDRPEDDVALERTAHAVAQAACGRDRGTVTHLYVRVAGEDRENCRCVATRRRSQCVREARPLLRSSRREAGERRIIVMRQGKRQEARDTLQRFLLAG